MEELDRRIETRVLWMAEAEKLVVTPAATVPAVAVEAGARLVILNRGETPLDGVAQLRLEEAIGEVFPPAVRELRERTGGRAGSTGPSTGPRGR